MTLDHSPVFQPIGETHLVYINLFPCVTKIARFCYTLQTLAYENENTEHRLVEMIWSCPKYDLALHNMCLK